MTARRLAPQPRADGEARVVARRVGARTRLADLFERGSAKIRLPRVEGDALHAVALNTAGGVTGGDRFAYAAVAGPGAHLTLATQTAERAYRAQPGETGRVAVSLRVEAGARLEWLAQETILFDGCALRRTIDVEMAADASLLLVEPVVLGRQAMGETVTRGFFSDFQRIHRAGRLVYADATRLSGPVAAQAARPSALGADRAWATIVYVAPDAEDRLNEMRSLIAGGEGGASAFDGLISARMVSSDSQELRRRLLRLLTGFRRESPPRVWEM